MLQAVALMQSRKQPLNPAWLSWVVDGAEALLALQRPDGSWGRAYSLDAAASDAPFDADPRPGRSGVHVLSEPRRP